MAVRSSVPMLRFGKTEEFAGLSGKALSDFDDVRPSAIVRELIQNSLDAVDRTDEKVAEVRFLLHREKVMDIPGISEYRKAFERVQKDGDVSAPARRVVSDIQKTLGEGEQDFLSVLDNGIGLDVDGMKRLLADGGSKKEDGSRGSFGVGHFVSIPASSLRYVLYGGVVRGGVRMASGHAILATHTVEGAPGLRSANGFLVQDFDQEKGHIFPDGASIPDLISRALNLIEQASGHGAAVIIPCFNYFRRWNKNTSGDILWKAISEAVACNFFVAIWRGWLIVRFLDSRLGNEKEWVLDRSSLSQVLKNSKGRTKAEIHAPEMYRALQEGDVHRVRTGKGEIEVHLLFEGVESRRVDLCRDGMWIAGGSDLSHSSFVGKFRDQRPFRALLLLDSTREKNLAELVREAEGPLHDRLDKTRLKSQRGKALRETFKDVKDWLENNIPLLKGETWDPAGDFLKFDFFGVGEAKRGGRGGEPQGPPVPVPPRPPRPPRPPGPPRPPPPPGPRPRPRPRPTLVESGPTLVVAVAPGRCQIHLEKEKGREAFQVRLQLDENRDRTWDAVDVDGLTKVFLADVLINGKSVGKDRLVEERGKIVGVRLAGEVAEGAVDIEAGYAFSHDLRIPFGHEPALVVEVLKDNQSAEGEDR